jgi:hypothetical protein
LLSTLCAPVNPTRTATFADGFDSFVGYLMLDALIGNTDRHHENWGVVSLRSATGHSLTIAPTYDHASSLGRELSDEKRRGRLEFTGAGRSVADYANKAFSAFWSLEGKRLTVLDVLRDAAAIRPEAFGVWQSHLRAVTLEALLVEVARVPPNRLTDIGTRFVRELLTHNYHRILEIVP